MKNIHNGESEDKNKRKKSKKTGKNKKENRSQYENYPKNQEEMVIEIINKDKEKGYDIV